MGTGIMFTMLPNGIEGNLLRVSVFVTPFFEAPNVPATLAGTPFEDWPQKLRGRTFQVQWHVGGPQSVALDGRADFAADRFDSVLWGKLFPATTRVEATSLARIEDRGIASYDTATMAEQVKTTYRAAAKTTAPRPRIAKALRGQDGLSKTVRNIAAAMRSSDAARTALARRTGETRYSKLVTTSLLGAAAQPIAREALRAGLQFDRRKAQAPAPVTSPAAPPPPPEFREILAHLGDYPRLLRRLGITFDLLIPRFGAQNERLTLKLVKPSIPGATVYCPWTSVLHTATDFQPYTDDSDYDQNGFLEPSRFHVESLDTDHAAAEIGAFSASADDELEGSPAGEIEVGLPALRTAGVAVHRRDREANIGTRFNHRFTLQENRDELNFVMGELVRGLRVDIKAGDGPWLSLCKRSVEAKVGNDSLGRYEDEGYIKSSAIAESASEPGVVQVSESVFHWTGWSLVAPRPGKTLASNPSNGYSESLVVPSVRTPGSMGINFAALSKPVRGSLPKLRFDQSYAVRLRLVDLAGNDLGRQIDTLPATEYSMALGGKLRRHEPVTSPTLGLRAKVTEGESLERMVIRSNPHGATPMGPTAYTNWLNAQKIGMSKEEYTARCERHVAPPKVAYQLAEMHGKLDGLLASPAQAYALAQKEEGTFLDDMVTDTATGQYKTVTTGRVVVTPPGARNSDGTRPAEIGTAAVARGAALAHGQYVIHPKPSHEVILPYLPDPLAAKLVLRGLAQPVVRTFKPRNGVAWPEVSVIGLALKGLPYGSPTVENAGDAANDLSLTIGLPPGAIARLRYSSGAATPEVLDVCDDAPGRERAARGENPLATPSRELVMVHAVQQPAKPVLRELDLSTPDRAEGETRQTIGGRIGVDGATTERVELRATWNEYADADAELGDAPGAAPVEQQGTVATFRVDQNATDVNMPADTSQAFGDTKRRTVKYQAVATTRFREYFPVEITSKASNLVKASDPVTRIVRSSARPPMPEVAYVLPTFKWKSGTSGNTTTRRRIGRGLRVYVRRPWYATGEDERLGLILARSQADMEARAPYVSVWGRDPVWFDRGTLPFMGIQSVVPESAPELDPHATLREVALAEVAGAKVDVITAQPMFNADRGLWYFDFEFAALNTYFPFVRLALARVQAESLPDLRLSRVVRADFAQLAADRTASVVTNADGSYGITVSGITGSNIEWTPSTSTAAKRTALDAASGHYVTAEVQESSSIAGTEDWERKGTAVVLMPSVSPANASRAEVAFEGTLRYPTGVVRPGARHRILVTEVERYRCDDQEEVRDGKQAIHAGGTAVAYAERVVYADAIDIPR